VTTLAAYEDYYRHRAQLWEIQALTRCRPVAGNTELGKRFRAMASVLTNFSTENIANGFAFSVRKSNAVNSLRKQKRSSANRGLTAFAADWKQQIARMRERIEKERTPSGQSALAIKTGAGGLIDAEFIAQTLCLEHGWPEPNTLRALEKAHSARALPERDARKLIDNFRQLRRIESILRRWSFEGEAVLPAEPEPFYRVSVRCGFKTPEEFRDAVASYRKAIREVYYKVFQLH